MSFRFCVFIFFFLMMQQTWKSLCCRKLLYMYIQNHVKLIFSKYGIINVTTRKEWCVIKEALTYKQRKMLAYMAITLDWKSNVDTFIDDKKWKWLNTLYNIQEQLLCCIFLADINQRFYYVKRNPGSLCRCFFFLLNKDCLQSLVITLHTVLSNVLLRCQWGGMLLFSLFPREKIVWSTRKEPITWCKQSLDDTDSDHHFYGVFIASLLLISHTNIKVILLKPEMY